MNESLTTDPRRWRRVAIAAAVAAAIVGTAPALFATRSADASVAGKPVASAMLAQPGSFATLVEQVKPAVVYIAAEGSLPDAAGPGLPPNVPLPPQWREFFQQQRPAPEAHAVGSGFIISADGLVVTNHHVIDGATRITVTLNDGRDFEAKVRGSDPKTDLALLEIDADGPLPHVDLGNSDTTRVGDWVVAVGNPFGLGGTVTAGIVSARGRDIHSGPYDDYLQIDAPINRGSSGGPLFDRSGKVVGVNTAIFSPSGGNVGIGFAIPASTAQPVIDQLRASGHVDRGFIGVQIQPVDESVAGALDLGEPHGALVAEVMPDGPAAAAGVRAGDVIVGFGGKPVEAFKDLSRLVAATANGTTADMEVWRDGRLERLEVTIGAMPGSDQVAAIDAPSVVPGQRHLGITLSALTPDAKRRNGITDDVPGVLVAAVDPDGPAARQGVQAGDIVRMVGQHTVATPQEAVEAIRSSVRETRPAVLLLVQRGDATRFITVPLRA